MSETFEEWFKEDGNGDFNYFSRDYYAGQWAPLIKHTWNHQAKKIAEKDAEIAEKGAEIESLKKAVSFWQLCADSNSEKLEKAKEAIYNECDKTTDGRGRKYLESVIKQMEAGE